MDRRVVTRRTALGAIGGSAIGLTAGCLGTADGDEDVLGDPEDAEGRPDPGGVSMEELPDLSGELTVYSGRSEPRIGELMEYIESEYDDFSLEVRYDDTADLVGAIEAEDETPADVFYGSETQSMTDLKDDGYTVELSEDVLDRVDERSRDPDGHWIGFTRRYRAVAYNTEAYDADDLPDDIFAYAEDDQFTGDIMWPPDQGSTQAFLTAMIAIHGEDETREWVETLTEEQDAEISPGGDSGLAQAVTDGEVSVGLTNHYTLADGPGDAYDITFTSGDAGAMYNATGGTVMADSDDQSTAEAFVEHLVSAEAQEYFATTTWEYPTIDGVEPIEEVPATDEFEPPEFDLNELADPEPAQEILRDVGVPF